MSQPDPVVLRAVSVRLGRSPEAVLEDVSLAIRPGKFVGVVGPTGCGKTTLLNVMAGVIPHYTPGEIEGEVLLFGRDTRTLSLRKTTADVGMVLQDPEAQLFNLVVRDEIVWGLENRGLGKVEMQARLDEAVAAFEIEHLRQRITYDLSGGEKQRVALASIYALKPRVVLLDNPTSQLDPIGAAKVFDAVRRLAAGGRFTIIMVEDKVDELLQHADRILVLDRGRLVLDGTPREFCLARQLRRRAGVRASQVAELAFALEEAGSPLPEVPLTLAEAVGLIKPRLGERRAPVDRPAAAKQARPAGWPAAAGAPAAAPVLVANGISFTYPPPRAIQALGRVDLSFAPGELVAIIGQNGSGKTTLAKCLSGYLRPTEGRVLSGDGLEVSCLTPAQRVRRVGYVFQNPDHQLFRETVWDEVAFGPRNVGLPADLVERLVGRMLQDLELEDKRHLHPFRLSKGDRQRLAVASIAVLRPAVLIVDEPTTGQDPVKAREIMDLLARLNRDEGVCVIIISHAMDLVAEYARRTIVMAGGAVLMDGPTREVFGRPEVLARSNVAPPPVSRLALALGLDEIPITIGEARTLLQSRWNG